MKIPREKLKLFSSEIVPNCSKQIDSLKNTGDLQKFTAALEKVSEWCGLYGKTEMGHWLDVLNDCDTLLELATNTDENGSMNVDKDKSLEEPVAAILQFTSYLFENTFSRSIYSSMERLIKLLNSSKIFIVVRTLRLLMVISKSSRFITQHLNSEMRKDIYNNLTALLEAWNGKLRSTSFAEFCAENFTLPSSFLTIQIRPDAPAYNVDLNKPLIDSAKELNIFMAEKFNELEKFEQISFFTKLRFLYSIHESIEERYQQVMARLISTSIIFYSRCMLGDESSLNGLANDQYIGQCCQFLHFVPPQKYKALSDAVKTETLKTLASIVFLEKNKKIQYIVDLLELGHFNGFCPTLLRNAVGRIMSGILEDTSVDGYSIPFVTALFSLIYHIAGFEYGGDALNGSTIVPTLLDVVKTHTLPEAYISFVIRSVRIIDILTGMDVTEFNSNDGTDIILNRFMFEVEQCKAHMQNATTLGDDNPMIICNQQRSGVMKSLLNFLKRAVVDVNLAAPMRRIMETNLPEALIHIIVHPQYYGSSLLHCSLMLTTNFIYQEPVQLAILQGKGLTNAIMDLIFDENLPISRDLVCAFPNVCSAMCLNENGLNDLRSYNNKKALERLFKIIFSSRFLFSMRKRKTEILETAQVLGTAFDELVRHQPTLRREVMNAIATVLDDMINFAKGTNANTTDEGDTKQPVISWGIGKTFFDDGSMEQIPLGDFMAMMGVMLETMLTNRASQENVQMLNECGVPVRLVRLLATVQKPNPILLNSNFLPNLACILNYVMRQSNKVDESFIYLLESCVDELHSYPTIKDDPHERLYQITRLSSLVSTISNMMKSLMHSQGSHDIRPFLLHFFVTNERARLFISTLFDTYKLMGSDKLLNAAQQTTTQILEDATKVRELLRIDDEQLSAPTATVTRYATLRNEGAMEWDSDLLDLQSSSRDSMATLANVNLNIFVQRTGEPSEDSSAASNSAAAMSSKIASEATTSANGDQSKTVERSIQQVAYRCQRQISELISAIGKNFCNVNVLRARQRAQQNAHLSPETLRKDYREMARLMFAGVKQLLEHDKSNAFASKPNQSLGLLKKLLIDDAQSIQQLLPEFYTSGCHRTFFSLVDACFHENVAKEEFGSMILVWIAIAQKLISASLLNADSKQGRGGTQQQQRTPIVDGFEVKNYLATSQKDTFAAICTLFKAVVKHCEETGTNTAQQSSSATPVVQLTTSEEDNLFKLLEKLLECLKFLLKDMMKLVELSEDRQDSGPEIPVSEIDPQKIQQLVEMGFSQSDAVDALLQNSSVPEAAEYLVSMLERNPTHGPARQEYFTASSRTPSQGEETTVAATASSVSTSEQAKPYSELLPLTRDELQERVEFLCNHIIGVCLGLISRSRSVVLGLSELIAVFSEDPQTRAWVKEEFIIKLIAELNTELDTLSGADAATLADEKRTGRMASMLHLFCLVWQNFPNQGIYKLLTSENAV